MLMESKIWFKSEAEKNKIAYEQELDIFIDELFEALVIQKPEVWRVAIDMILKVLNWETASNEANLMTEHCVCLYCFALFLKSRTLCSLNNKISVLFITKS